MVQGNLWVHEWNIERKRGEATHNSLRDNHWWQEGVSASHMVQELQFSLSWSSWVGFWDQLKATVAAFARERSYGRSCCLRLKSRDEELIKEFPPVHCWFSGFVQFEFSSSPSFQAHVDHTEAAGAQVEQENHCGHEWLFLMINWFSWHEFMNAHNEWSKMTKKLRENILFSPFEQQWQ